MDSQKPAFDNVTSYAIDDVAYASLRAGTAQPEQVSCGVCDAPIAGDPAGTGFFMWTRGEEVRFDSPPLCGSCAAAMSLTAHSRWYGDGFS